MIGDPDAPSGSKKAQLFEKGVSLYGTASLPRTLIQIVYSAIYPYLLIHVSPGQLMSISFGLFGAVLFVSSGTHISKIGQLVVVLMGLPIAAHFTLPVGLTVENSDSSNRGRYLGALNCFAVIPQLIDTGYVVSLNVFICQTASKFECGQAITTQGFFLYLYSDFISDEVTLGL